MKQKTIYNPNGLDNGYKTKLINGNPSGIINLNNIKYQWAYKLWNVMLANTWTAGEVTLNDDVKEYKTLTIHEKQAYDKALSQLIFMDSIQTNHIMDNINPYITAPEINILLARQSFEEALHSQSYAVLVDSISTDSDHIYNLWRDDKMLRDKNDEIASIYGVLSENPSEENILKSMFANICLEGIYFYSGFTYFYVLSRSGKMRGTAQMIKFINRDEDAHLAIYQNMINIMRKENPDLFTKKLEEEMTDMFKKACELEILWGKYITGRQILGFTDEIIKDYIQSITDKRLKSVGLQSVYGSKNPIKWVNDYRNFNDQRVNFFEGNVTNYKVGGLNMEEDF